MAGLTDAVAAAIVGGGVDATVNRGLLWNPVNLRRDGMPSKIEGRVRVDAPAVAEPFELMMRLCPDKPWSYTCVLLHRTSGANVRRLDVRGTHRDRRGGRVWLNRTHKHRWSEAEGDRDVYTPVDIRHEPAVPVSAGMKDLADEYRQVFEDFTKECLIRLVEGYMWQHPPYPEPDQPIPTLERYP